MRLAVVAATLGVLLASAATSSAQWRGTLTSRPSSSVTVPRAPLSPVPLVPVWWPWGVVMLPQTTTLSPPRLGEDAPSGGVQLDVTPWSAQVFVDGALAGQVEEFRGYYHHLSLPAGPHSIAIVATGHEPHVFDVVVVPGKTLTYRATLR